MASAGVDALRPRRAVPSTLRSRSPARSMGIAGALATIAEIVCASSGVSRPAPTSAGRRLKLSNTFHSNRAFTLTHKSKGGAADVLDGVPCSTLAGRRLKLSNNSTAIAPSPSPTRARVGQRMFSTASPVRRRLAGAGRPDAFRPARSSSMNGGRAVFELRLRLREAKLPLSPQ